jgi:outer membrane receptor protein involved in Fe transport
MLDSNAMKKNPFSLSRVLLAATMLYAPSMVAVAQQATPPAAPQTQPQSPPPAEEAADAADAAGETEIVVQGRFIPEPMRQTSEVATFLSEAELERTGDDNAAAALTRLTGLSVVSSRFVYVRGLGDRYSSALLNGSPLPSPEPLRRQVPLDLFPSNILSGAVVQKTFSPNYPGEFGGGIIDLRTLRMPNETFFSVKAATGANTESTTENGFFYYGSGTDDLGYDNGTRDVPTLLSNALRRRVPINDSNFSATELERIGESVVNSNLYVVQRGRRPVDFEGEVSGGTSIDIGKYNVGLIAAGGFDNSWRTRRALREGVVGNALERRFKTTTTTGDVVANLFGSASLGWDENEISLSTFLVRSSTKYTQVETGVDFNLPGTTGTNPADNERVEATGWYERTLGQIQLSGEHEFGERWELDWRGAVAQSTRDAPYERSIRYDVINGEAAFSGAGGFGNSLRFSELTDEVVSAGADASYTFPLSEQREAKLSGGFAYSNTVRNFELFAFSFLPRGPLPADVTRARVDFLFGPDNIDPRRFVLTEQTGPDDSYKGRLTNVAYYLAADADILPLVRASIGVRYEDATQNVRTLNRFGATPFAPVVNLSNTYWLPAATLTWNFAEDLQLRLGYSQTIARPQFRELAFSQYIDPDTDRIYGGNPFLVDSKFENYDARVEYYFGRDRFVTFGGFYKTIENPIEEVITPRARLLTNFINAPEATLYGGEAEFRTKFGAPVEIPFFKDADWIFATNYTYTKSEVNAPAGSTVFNPGDNFRRAPASQFGLDGTPLQGTPEHIFNLQFGFESDISQLTLLVGWVDERVLRRGLGAVQPVIEKPGVNVDLVFRRDFTVGQQDFTLGVSGRNLLGEDNEEFQIFPRGRNEVNTYDRGQSFSVSLTAKY